MCIKRILFLLSMISTAIAEEEEFCGGAIDPDKDLNFIEIGKFTGPDRCEKSYNSRYYIPRQFKAYWFQMPGICKSYGMTPLAIETAAEAKAVLHLLKPYKDLDDVFFIGGMALKAASLTDWYWINNGQKISFALDWNEGQPDGWTTKDNTWLGREKCLSIAWHKGKLGFNDVFCSAFKRRKFICEKSNGKAQTDSEAWEDFSDEE